MTKRDEQVVEHARKIKNKSNCLDKAMIGGEGCYFLMDTKLSAKKWPQEQVENVKFCKPCYINLKKIAEKNQHCFSNKLKKIVLKKNLNKLLKEHDLKKSNLR